MTISSSMSEDPALTPRPETSLNDRPSMSRGEAPIKKEYLIDKVPTVESTSSHALNTEAPYSTADDDAEGSTTIDARGSKRRKTAGGPGSKKERGQNKSRHFPIMRDSNVKMCKSWETTGTCAREKEGNCRFTHSWKDYFETKPRDISFMASSALYDEAPFVRPKEDGVISSGRQEVEEDEVGKSLDFGTECPVFKDIGWCPFGWRCRFLGAHIKYLDQVDETTAGPSHIGRWELLGHDEVGKHGKWSRGETNWPAYGTVADLRSSSYPFRFSEKYLHYIEPQKEFRLGPKGDRRPKQDSTSVSGPNGMTDEEAAMNATNGGSGMTNDHGVVDGQTESLDVPLRPEEKRKLPFEGGLYLAPLTTVGNLPFRRLCVDYGATITLSEMALAQPLVLGQMDEFALLRKHQSEKTFGVQIAGGYANRMVPCAEMLAREFSDGIDFVDVNLGCPIDLIFNQGAGSALMDAPGRLGKFLIGMNRALGDIPLTVKFRTGVAMNKPNAHKLIPRFAKEWGASAMTLHGRSRQQRYSKLADWEYIRQCVTTLRETTDEAGLPRIPMFGNGDCFSAQSYYEEMEKSGVDGVMIARGALIKPWIFTEVKERREWDISATERLDGIRKFAEYGLSHWGSDTQGVSKTRRFLCEALSFQHRYIPIGLLERLPPMLNERPPAYRGRSELETLLSSPFVGDWIKISEMFLGPVEQGWNFVPKHKSNAYGGEEAQG